MVKLDSSGNIIWQKCFGGSGVSDEFFESFSDIILDNNGNYIACGFVYSKDGDISFNH